MPRLTFFPVLVPLLLLPAIHALRGVHPSSRDNLASGITCVLRDAPANGPVSLPSSRVNDDYCDCQDGSDEPGTSACPGAVFWCRNVAFRPVKIPSSWVDDGHCDCCDGSDEPPGACPDTCKQDAERVLSVAKKQANAIREGVAIRAKYAKEGARAADKDKLEIQNLERELKEIEAQLKKSQSRTDRLRRRRDYEDQLRRAAEKHSAQRENEPQTDDANGDTTDPIDKKDEHLHDDDTANDSEGDAADPVDLDSATDNPNANDEQDREAHFDDEMSKNAESEENNVDSNANTDDMHDERENEEDEHEDYDDDGDNEYDDDDDDDDDYDDDEDDEDDGSSNAKCSVCGGDGEDEEDKESKPKVEESPPEDKEADTEAMDVDMVCAELGAQGPNAIVRKFNYLKTVLASKLQRILPISLPAMISRESVSECLRKAENAKYDLENKKRDIEDKLKKLKEKNGIYYGSDGALRKLHGSCIKKAVTQYEFELCPFDLVRQYEHGSAIAVLGRFKGWKGEEGSRVMNYAQGDRCWNGPPRSIKVELSCGETEEIVSVEEPNRCAYMMKFKTPAVCESAAADAVLEELEQPENEAKEEL